MFSGIVEMMGHIKEIQTQDDCMTLEILPATPMNDLKIGDSISVNGVCLTVTELLTKSFQVNIVSETLRVTNLGLLKMGHVINLERSFMLSSRLGGHFVQGHVDETGEVLSIEKEGEGGLLAKISISEHISKYIIHKGFIAIDGMSITVIHSGPNWFTVTFIPHTQKSTITHQYQPGTLVNIEVDMMGKYIEKLLEARS